MSSVGAAAVVAMVWRLRFLVEVARDGEQGRGRGRRRNQEGFGFGDDGEVL